MRMKTGIVLMTMAFSAFAQTQKQPVLTAKPEGILKADGKPETSKPLSDADKLKIREAQLQVATAESQLTQSIPYLQLRNAQAQLQKITTDLQATCGGTINQGLSCVVSEPKDSK